LISSDDCWAYPRLGGSSVNVRVRVDSIDFISGPYKSFQKWERLRNFP